MAAIPQDMTTAAAIQLAYERGHRASGMVADDRHRPHMGASLIGHECDRAIWYTWRWVEREQFDGRMLRLFETGHMAEARIVSDLRATGATVHDTDAAGKQWRICDHAGHFAGSMDGCAIGLVEAPKTWHVTEFKTHSDKSFTKLSREGVLKAKPRHYDQMTVYMGQTGMDRALYVAVNKNTDAIYTERVELDKARYDMLMARAARILAADEPPAGISTDPSWFECKFCTFKEVCHGTQTPEVNCRTCAHSTPDLTPKRTDGRWHCNVPSQPDGGGAGVTLSVDEQRDGCSEHRYIPIFLKAFAKPVDYHNGDVVFETLDGGRFANGTGPGAIPSTEIRRCGAKSALPEITDYKLAFPGAKIVA